MSAAVERLSCAEDAVQTHLLCISFLVPGEGYVKVSLCHAVRRKPVNLNMYK